MKKIYLKRLEGVVYALRKTKPKEFDMSAWGVVNEKHPCKTIGCAAGRYCVIHPRAALKLEFGPAFMDERAANVVLRIRKGKRTRKFTSDDALIRYFGLIPGEQYIFYESDRTNKDDSKKGRIALIKKFIKLKGGPPQFKVGEEVVFTSSDSRAYRYTVKIIKATRRIVSTDNNWDFDAQTGRWISDNGWSNAWPSISKIKRTRRRK